MKLKVLPIQLAISQIDPKDVIPSWATAGAFWSLTKTEDELSVVCETSSVPFGINSNSGWRALMVQGPLDFSLVGVMAEISNALAAAGVSIFVISTFDTDIILVKDQDLAKSMSALKCAGHSIAAEEGEG